MNQPWSLIYFYFPYQIVATNIDLISANGHGINYTPNPTAFSQMNTNGSINNSSSYDHPSPNSNNGMTELDLMIDFYETSKEFRTTKFSLSS